MEMADAFVIHKADGNTIEAAEKAKSAYQNALNLFPNEEKSWSPQVVLASSLSGLGVEKVWRLMQEYEEKVKASGFWETNRSEQRLSWLHDQIQEMLGQAFLKSNEVKSILLEQKPKVKSGQLHPGVLARQLIEVFLNA
jgi:LAO/AO transport system kinase